MTIGAANVGSGCGFRLNEALAFTPAALPKSDYCNFRMSVVGPLAIRKIIHKRFSPSLPLLPPTHLAGEPSCFLAGAEQRLGLAEAFVLF